MAILILEHDGRRQAAVLPRRVLIGRRSMNHLVINHRTVSRMHAWIDGADEHYSVTDTGSRTGTWVNGELITSRHRLSDGDRIAVGPVTLTFVAGREVPPGVEEIDLSGEPVVAAEEKGFRFDCPCGAPLFAGMEFAGHNAQCVYCGRALTVPYPSGTRAAAAVPQTRAAERPADEPMPAAPVPAEATPVEASRPEEPRPGTDVAPPPPAPAAPALARETREMCGVCQSAIRPFEEKTHCPSCGLAFHAECWAENYGCSAYGCSQVNALMPPEPVPAGGLAEGTFTPVESVDGPDADPADRHAGRFPWEFLFLAGSVFSTLIGAVTFGVPALAVAGGAAAYLARNRGSAGQRTGVVLVSAALALLGVVTGAAVSYVLYFSGRRWG